VWKPITSVFLLTLFSEAAPPIAWHPWSEDAFARARVEHRLVILHLEAVWCHWCHVMEHDTYGDPRIKSLIADRYVPVRVDSDARPDLAARYKRYGWPATVIFAADGTELVKRRGYIEPGEMLTLLSRTAADPIPEKDASEDRTFSFVSSPILSKEVRDRLTEAHVRAQDRRLGGLLRAKRYLDLDSVEWSIARALEGDAEQESNAKRTIDASLALIDRVWGGAYQYSTHADWGHPHFEKIMSTQADVLRAYALGFAMWKDQRVLAAASSIHRYLRAFLRDPSGAFYTSQDADLVAGEHSSGYFALDDGGRRALGIPRIDRHIYAQENGWIIEALAQFGAAAKDSGALGDALAATRAIAKTRALEGGGYRHGESDAGGPYLGDTLAMGRAFLALYEATQDRAHLLAASKAADFIRERFRGEASSAGFVTTASPPSARLAAVIDLEENIALARFFTRLNRYTGRSEHREAAERAMRFLATPSVTEGRFTEPGVLLADRALSSSGLHVTVVGPKRDPEARALLEAALALPFADRRIEHWDPKEGPLLNPDVRYPVLGRSAAFVCTAGACSTPIFDPSEIAESVRRLPRR
jgi:uncharacterized protein